MQIRGISLKVEVAVIPITEQSQVIAFGHLARTYQMLLLWRLAGTAKAVHFLAFFGSFIAFLKMIRFSNA